MLEGTLPCLCVIEVNLRCTLCHQYIRVCVTSLSPLRSQSDVKGAVDD